MRLWMWGAGMAVLYGVLFLWFICQVRKPDYKKHYVFTKTEQSAAFLLVFLVAAGVSGDMRNLWRMLPAFVCCFAGDVLLAFYNKVREKKIFLSGLVAFLLGHLFFIRWLNRMQSITITDVVIPAMAVLLMFFVTGMGCFHTGRLRPCILVYSFFIAYLFAKSMHIALCLPDWYHSICAVGSFLFMISDISILFLYFYKNRNRRIHLFNLTTYYMGIFLLAVSPLFY